MRQPIKTDVLVVGSGTAGTAAAVQCARRGIRVALVGQDGHLGGMLTAQGVSATDGNELTCFQTGFWRAFLQELYRRAPLHHSWVSFFSFDPQVGAAIFRDWVEQMVPRLLWLPNQQLLEVQRSHDRITGAMFTDYEITAAITIEATELGDVLALGGVPHRWGWETQDVFNEPSAPAVLADLHRQYPVQAITWVGLLRGQPSNPMAVAGPFQAALRDHAPLRFLRYGALTPDLYMLNWPLAGNDYAVDLDRLIAGPGPRAAVFREAQAHTLAFMQYVQAVFGQSLQPAEDIFPQGLAPQPYLRESRRVIGRQTITEWDILPLPGGQVAALHPDTIAFGNYANDHHYPGDQWPVQPKSRRWGGRWTGTPFGIPYGCLIPERVTGLLVTEKNISVSHIANGATRLQPLVLNLGQVAGMAAALCIEKNCLPHELSVPLLQQALLSDATAGAGVVPFYNLAPSDPRYPALQEAILAGKVAYSCDGLAPVASPTPPETRGRGTHYQGTLRVEGPDSYTFIHPELGTIQLVTLEPTVVEFLAQAPSDVEVTVEGTYYPNGIWLQAVAIQ